MSSKPSRRPRPSWRKALPAVLRAALPAVLRAPVRQALHLVATLALVLARRLR